MAIFWVILAALLFLSLGIKQMSFILVHGSVFESLRHAIQLRMERGSWFFQKLNELFTCKLCMTAQVSIWAAALPALLVSSYFGGPAAIILGQAVPWWIDLIVASFGTFASVMALAALALGWWTLLEYLPTILEREEEYYKQQLDIMRSNMRDAQALKSLQFSAKDFYQILGDVEYACQGIGCGYARRRCREHALTITIADWFANHRNGYSRNVEQMLLAAIGSVLPDYFRNRWRQKDDQLALKQYRLETFQRLQAELSA